MISETVTMDVELPDLCSGYRAVGFRVPRYDDWYFCESLRKPLLCQVTIHEAPKMILEPIKVWRPVRINDLIKCLTIGSMDCRASFGGEWQEGALHAARPIADGYNYYVQIGDRLNWTTRVEVMDER